jgi:hypothetical protein
MVIEEENLEQERFLRPFLTFSHVRPIDSNPDSYRERFVCISRNDGFIIEILIKLNYVLLKTIIIVLLWSILLHKLRK